MLNAGETRAAVEQALAEAFKAEGLVGHSSGASCRNTWEWDLGMHVPNGPASLELRGCKGGFVSCEVVPAYFAGKVGESPGAALERHRFRVDYGRARWPQDGDTPTIPANFLAAAREVVNRSRHPYGGSWAQGGSPGPLDGSTYQEPMHPPAGPCEGLESPYDGYDGDLGAVRYAVMDGVLHVVGLHPDSTFDGSTLTLGLHERWRDHVDVELVRVGDDRMALRMRRKP